MELLTGLRPPCSAVTIYIICGVIVWYHGPMGNAVPRTRTNPTRKLFTPETEERIYELHEDQGYKKERLAEMYGCSFSTICNVIRRIRNERSRKS